MKIYYNFPIQALYMMEHFGIKFHTERGNKICSKSILDDLDNLIFNKEHYETEKYFVKFEKMSDPIFPQIGDLVIRPKSLPEIHAPAYKANEKDIQAHHNLANCGWRLNILKRAEKTFLSPIYEDQQ